MSDDDWRTAEFLLCRLIPGLTLLFLVLICLAYVAVVSPLIFLSVLMLIYVVSAVFSFYKARRLSK